MTIGNRISTLRKEHQLSQEDIADRINVTRQSVSKWETDTSAPDAYNLIALAKVLNTSVEYIVTGKEDTNKVEQTTPKDINCEKTVTKRSNLSIVGFILLGAGILISILGMFLHEIWCIIGGYIAVTGIIFALVKKEKLFYIFFSIIAVLIVITVLLLTL